MRSALRYMASHPLHFLRNYAYKLCNFLLYPPANSSAPTSAPFPFREIRWLLPAVIGAGLLGLGLLLCARRGEPTALVVLLVIGYLWAFGALFHITRDGRMNLGFRALLSIPAAFAIVYSSQLAWRCTHPDPKRS